MSHSQTRVVLLSSSELVNGLLAERQKQMPEMRQYRYAALSRNAAAKLQPALRLLH